MYDEFMDERSIEALQASLAGVCGHVNAQQARLVRLVERALVGEAWKQIGIHSASHWLAWQAGVTTSTAQKVLAVARRAEQHPLVMAAFDNGELSLDQVVLAVKAPAYTDAEICGLARVLTVQQLSMVVRKYPFTSDAEVERRNAAANGESTQPAPGPVEAAPDGVAVSSVSMGTDSDGVGQVRGVLAPDDYRVFETAMRECRDALFHDGDPSVDWADALIEICHRSLDTVVEPSRRDRFRINLYVDVNGTTTFADNWRVPDSIRDRLFCDGTITPVGLVGGIAVNVGRSQRIVPERTRRVVEHRDLGCRVPGCNQSRWVHVHHIIHWDADDGPTDTWNLICLCPRHHRLHHHGQLGITGNADLPAGTPGAVVFTDIRGSPLKPAADPAAPTAPPPEPADRYVHPLGERLDRWAIHFNEPHPQRTS